MKELGIKELAIEDSSISYAEFKQLEEKVGCHIVSGDGIVEGVRVIKDEYELEAIRKAQEIADMAFTHMLNYLKPGLTEIEAALELEMFCAATERRRCLLIRSWFPGQGHLFLTGHLLKNWREEICDHGLRLCRRRLLLGYDTDRRFGQRDGRAEGNLRHRVESPESRRDAIRAGPPVRRRIRCVAI